MQILRLVLARFRGLFRRDVVASEIHEEMQFHLDMRSQEYGRDGVAADEAKRAATKRFGNLALMQDRGYDIRGGGVIETLVQDLRYGVRLLLKDRGFSGVAILTLALGIGASTALFSVTDAALLRPLPYQNPEELVEISVDVPQPGGRRFALAPSLTDVRAWRESGRIVSHAGIARMNRSLIVDTGEIERLNVSDVSEDFIEVYGVGAILGRMVTLQDTLTGASPVVMLGHRYWRRRFDGNANVLGHLVQIDGVPATVVGVLPPLFFDDTAIWRANGTGSWQRRGSGAEVRGRLRTGLTLDQAERELTDLAGRLEPGVGVQLRSAYDSETRGYDSTLTILSYAVGLILAIACTNVAGLLLARGAGRQAELALRASLGAGRGRLVRQLLTENLVLSLVGGVVGVILAWLSLDALVAIIPMSLPPNSPPTINVTVLGATVLLSIASAIVVGLVPAFRLSRVQPGAQIAAVGRRHGPALSRRGGQRLIAVEVALAVVLLAGAGLCVRSFARLMAVDVGFDSDAILTMEVETLNPSPEEAAQYYPALLDAIRILPGVAAVGAVDNVPLYGVDTSTPVSVDGKELSLSTRQVLPGYFEALGLRPKQGRVFASAERVGGEPVVVINEVTAARFFPEGSPVGRSFQPNRLYRTYRVIGVVPNIRHYGPESQPESEAFFLYGQMTPRVLTVVLRLAGSAVSADRLRRVALAVGPRVLVGRIRSGSDLLGLRVMKPRHQTVLLSLLGGGGLLVTLVGIFSMTAYAVARRTQEIGVRMAFGARPADVVLAIVRDALGPVSIGLAMGMVVAYFATQVVKAFLFETTPHDPVTFVAIGVLMVMTALLAAWVPALRAARVDPVTALRAD